MKHEPCMCGADDCPRCFPENFNEEGEYICDYEQSDDETSEEFEERMQSEHEASLKRRGKL